MQPVKHFAYAAQRGGKWIMVIDEQEGKDYDGIGRDIIFSPDSKRFAYSAMLNKKWFRVIDGQKETEYDDVAYGIFSPDSKRFAYSAEREGKWIMVIDDQEGKESFFSCNKLVWESQDQLNYLAKMMVIDGQEGKELLSCKIKIYMVEEKLL